MGTHNMIINNKILRHAFKKVCSIALIIAFVVNLVLPQAYAQNIFPAVNLPVPGTAVMPTPGFSPMLIKGVNIHPEDALVFDFLIDKGDAKLEGDAFKDESQRLIKYFLAALAVPENQMWVNLSPYEKDRIVPDVFGATEMGRDLLAQDYLLKQLTSSLTNPEGDLGDEFWTRVRSKAKKQFGTEDVPMNTFNKIWIVPERAQIYEHEKGAYVTNAYLKVMLEEDYLALEVNKNSMEHGLGNVKKEDLKVMSGVQSEVIREILIPEIEREVNEGATFANLRQIYYAVILASWYKEALKESLLGQAFADKGKTEGLLSEDKQVNQRIYEQYVEAFKKGAYDLVKDDYDPDTQTVVSRKYFSGGATLNPEESGVMVTTSKAPLDEVEIVTARMNQAAGDVRSVNSKIIDLAGGELRLKYLQTIQKWINRSKTDPNQKKAALYLGAGSDILTALMTTDASDLIFIDRGVFDKSIDQNLKKDILERYLKNKEVTGYVDWEFIDTYGIWLFLEEELRILGATSVEVEIDSNDSTHSIVRFEWQGRQRVLHYISEMDILDSAKYESYWNEYGGVDYVIWKAVHTRIWEDFRSTMDSIVINDLKSGGALIADEYYSVDREALGDVLTSVGEEGKAELKVFEDQGVSLGYNYGVNDSDDDAGSIYLKRGDKGDVSSSGEGNKEEQRRKSVERRFSISNLLSVITLSTTLLCSSGCSVNNGFLSSGNSGIQTNQPSLVAPSTSVEEELRGFGVSDTTISEVFGEAKDFRVVKFGHKKVGRILNNLSELTSRYAFGDRMSFETFGGVTFLSQNQVDVIRQALNITEPLVAPLIFLSADNGNTSISLAVLVHELMHAMHGLDPQYVATDEGYMKNKDEIMAVLGSMLVVRMVNPEASFYDFIRIQGQIEGISDESIQKYVDETPVFKAYQPIWDATENEAYQLVEPKNFKLVLTSVSSKLTSIAQVDESLNNSPDNSLTTASSEAIGDDKLEFVDAKAAVEELKNMIGQKVRVFKRDDPMIVNPKMLSSLSKNVGRVYRDVETGELVLELPTIRGGAPTSEEEKKRSAAVEASDIAEDLLSEFPGELGADGFYTLSDEQIDRVLELAGEDNVLLGINAVLENVKENPDVIAKLGFSYQNGQLRYPDFGSLLEMMELVSQSGLRFKRVDGKISDEQYLRYFADGFVPIANTGMQHFHDTFVHSLGFMFLNQRDVKFIQAKINLFMRLKDQLDGVADILEGTKRFDWNAKISLMAEDVDLLSYVVQNFILSGNQTEDGVFAWIDLKIEYLRNMIDKNREVLNQTLGADTVDKMYLELGSIIAQEAPIVVRLSYKEELLARINKIDLSKFNRVQVASSEGRGVGVGGLAVKDQIDNWPDEMERLIRSNIMGMTTKKEVSEYLSPFIKYFLGIKDAPASYKDLDWVKEINPQVLIEMGSRLRAVFNEGGENSLRKRFGLADLYFYEEIWGFVGAANDPKHAIARENLGYLLQGASVEDRLIGLWSNGVMLADELNSAGLHDFNDGEAFDFRELKVSVRKYIALMIQLKKESPELLDQFINVRSQQASEGKREITYRDYLYWGLWTMFNPDFFDESGIYQDLTKFLDGRKPDQVALEEFSRVLSEIYEIDQLGYETEQIVDPRLIKELFEEAFQYDEEHWQENGYALPWQVNIPSNSEPESDWTAAYMRARPELRLNDEPFPTESRVRNLMQRLIERMEGMITEFDSIVVGAVLGGDGQGMDGEIVAQVIAGQAGASNASQDVLSELPGELGADGFYTFNVNDVIGTYRENGGDSLYLGIENFVEYVKSYPIVMERLGFTYKDGQLRYPGLGKLRENYRRAEELLGLGHKPPLDYVNVEGKIPDEEFLRNLVEGFASVSSTGEHHYHEMFFHSLSYLLVSPEMAEVIKAKAKLLLFLKDNMSQEDLGTMGIDQEIVVLMRDVDLFSAFLQTVVFSRVVFGDFYKTVFNRLQSSEKLIKLLDDHAEILERKFGDNFRERFQGMLRSVDENQSDSKEFFDKLMKIKRGLDEEKSSGTSQLVIEGKKKDLDGEGLEKGGIDMNALILKREVKKNGRGVIIPISSIAIEDFNVDGLVPVILNVTPVGNLPLLLGAENSSDPVEDSTGVNFDLSSLVDRKNNLYLSYYFNKVE